MEDEYLMLFHTKALALGLLAFGCCFSPSSFAAPDAQTSKLETSWYKAFFETQFPPISATLPPANGSVVLYKNKTDFVGLSYPAIFKPISRELRAALLAPTTTNPFTPLFPALHTPESLKKLNQCQMLSVKFELDDKNPTTEWVVAFSQKQCLSADASEALRSGDTEPHYWVIQKAPDNNYRVLAEGDGNIYITNQQKEQGYKEIRTLVLLKHAFPNNALQCGGAVLTWRYRNKGYYLADTEVMAQDCQPLYFPELTGQAWQNAYDEYKRRATVLVDQWINTASSVR